MNARTSWSLRGERANAPEREEPWDADPGAIGDLSEARFDDSGRLRVVPSGEARNRIAERGDEPGAEISPHALEQAVERLARDIEGWRQDDEARSAPQRRPASDFPPPRNVPPAGRDLTASLDRLMARIEALDERLESRAAPRRPAPRPDPLRDRNEPYGAARSTAAEPPPERHRRDGGREAALAAARPDREFDRPDRRAEDPVPGDGGITAALAELRTQLAALQARSTAPGRVAEVPAGGFRKAAETRTASGWENGRAAVRQPEADRGRPGEPPQGDRAAAELRHRVEEIRDQLRRLPSQEQVGRLEGHLLQLAERIDGIAEQAGGSRDLQRVETQLASLAAQIGELRRTRMGAAAELEHRLAQVAARLDAFDIPPAPVDLGPVEDRISEIGGRLDELLSQPAAPSLARIEKQLAVLAKVVERQEQQGAARLQAALEQKLEAFAAATRREESGGADALAAIATRIEALQATLARRDSAAPSPQLDQIERKLDQLQNRIAASGRGEERLAQHFAPIAEQLAALSRHLEEGPPAVDLAPLAQRLERLEQRLDERLAALGPALREADDPADAEERTALRADIAALRRELRAVPVRSEEGVAGLLQTVANRLDRILREPPATMRELEQQVTRIIGTLQGADPDGSALAEIDSRLRDIQDRLDAASLAAADDDEPPLRDHDVVAELARALKSDLGALKGAAESSERNTRESLEAVHETLEAVMKRMAFLEKDAPAAAPPAAETAAAGMLDRAPAMPPPQPDIPEISLTGRRGDDKPAFVAPPLKPAPAEEAPRPAAGGLLGRLTASQLLRRATGGRTESFSPVSDEPEDGGDLPLEPGTNAPLDSALSGAPSSDTALMTGAARAALGPAPHQKRPADLNQPPEAVGSAADGRRRPAAGDDFLVAARRAAQAAAAEAAEAERSASQGGKGALGRMLAVMKARRRMVLAGVLALAVALTALQFVRSNNKGEAERIAAPVVEGPSVSATAVVPAPSAQKPQSVAAAPAPTGTPASAAVTGEAGRSGAPAAATEMPAPSPVAAHPLPPPGIGPETLRRAAAGGDTAAQFEIASRYAEGRGVAQDLAAAADWYRRAAESGLAPAQYRLGSIYEKGLGVAKDFALAQQWYRRAAEAGNVKAMHNLAVLYAEGAGGEPDLKAAAALFRRAADHGVRDSQFNLAILHARGLGVPQDMIEAYKWFAVAARSGDPESEKRREVVAAALGASDLAKAKAAAEAFQPLPVDSAANLVTEPEGGWGPPPQKTSLGAEADLVARAQALLAEVGFDPGPADGTNGPRTRDAVSAFQKKAGLPVTGVIDTGLISALQSRSG